MPSGACFSSNPSLQWHKVASSMPPGPAIARPPRTMVAAPSVARIYCQGVEDKSASAPSCILLLRQAERSNHRAHSVVDNQCVSDIVSCVIFAHLCSQMQPRKSVCLGVGCRVRALDG